MDPVSFAASIVTLVGVTTATGKGLKKLASLKNVPDQLLQLHNEVADFEAVIVRLNRLATGLTDSDDQEFVSRLDKLCLRAGKALDDIQTLLREIVGDWDRLDSLSNGKINFSKKRWLQEQRKVQRSLMNLRETRKAIADALTELFPSSVPNFRIELKGIRSITNGLESTLQSLDARSQDSDALIRGIVPTMERLELSMEALRREPQLASPPVGAPTASITLEYTSPSPRPTPILPQLSPVAGIEIDTMLYEKVKCNLSMCGCRCHRVSRYRNNPYLAMVVGSLFVGYSGIPFENRPPCDEKLCVRETGGLVKMTYYFPSWVPIKRMIALFDRWQNPGIHHIDIQIPRIVPSSAEVFVLAQRGNVHGIHALFQAGRASVYDVSAGEGRSILHYALTGGQPNVVAYLLSKQASINLEDKMTLSPLDCLWNYLLEDSTDPLTVALRIPFAQFLDESEDLQRRNFTTLHRILFGLSETTLDTYLKLSTAEIDIPCSLGRTPLCWAALRKDFLPVQTLVKFGAALHLRDWRGQSPFHFAAETGAFESLKILLDAAASKSCVPQNQVTIDQNTTVSEFCLSLIEARDSKGRTPLHFSTRVNFVAHANILLRYGADINSADNVQRTPLLVAIYWNHHDMLELLLARGARTDVLDINRMTVLHYAAKFGDWKTLEALRREGIGGISADMRDSAGYTPMETFDQLRSIFIAEDPDTLTRSRLIMEALLVDNTDVESEFTDDELFFDALASLEASVSSLDGLTNGVNDLLSVTEVAP